MHSHDMTVGMTVFAGEVEEHNLARHVGRVSVKADKADEADVVAQSEEMSCFENTQTTYAATL